MNQNIIITGSSGFIGKHFVKNTNEFTIHEVDLLTQKIDEVNFKNIDSVLHLAAIVHQMKGAPEDKYFKVNRDLAFEVAKKAKKSGVKQFVLMSTAKVFGEFTELNMPWSEKDECRPKDFYAKSKLEAEKLVFGLQDKNFSVAIIRSPLVYGEKVKANMLNLVKLIELMPILPLGDIQNSRSLVYVGNLVALIIHIIKKQSSGIIIAKDQKSVSTSQLVSIIAKCLGKKIWLFKMPNFIKKGLEIIKPSIIDRLYDSLELDNRITNEELDFIPPFSIEQGISEMVDWYISCYKK